jgi:hypothetical protein
LAELASVPPPGTILGAGDVAILLGSGLQAKWTGIAQPLTSQSATILVGPGQIGVMLTFATQPFSETFQLWQGRGGARNSTIEFDYPAQFSRLRVAARPGEIAKGSSVHPDGSRTHGVTPPTETGFSTLMNRRD